MQVPPIGVGFCGNAPRVAINTIKSPRVWRGEGRAEERVEELHPIAAIQLPLDAETQVDARNPIRPSGRGTMLPACRRQLALGQS